MGGVGWVGHRHRKWWGGDGHCLHTLLDIRPLICLGIDSRVTFTLLSMVGSLLTILSGWFVFREVFPSQSLWVSIPIITTYLTAKLYAIGGKRKAPSAG